MVLTLYKARELEDHEVPELHDLIRTLTKRADLPAVPRLYYVPSQMLNAFAVGKKEDSAIAVTDGLLRNMNLRADWPASWPMRCPISAMAISRSWVSPMC